MTNIVSINKKKKPLSINEEKMSSGSFSASYNLDRCYLVYTAKLQCLYGAFAIKPLGHPTPTSEGPHNKILFLVELGC